MCKKNTHMIFTHKDIYVKTLNMVSKKVEVFPIDWRLAPNF